MKKSMAYTFAAAVSLLAYAGQGDTKEAAAEKGKDKTKMLSFTEDIYPSFAKQQCPLCHVKGHQSGLVLKADAQTVYQLLKKKKRINLELPNNSLLLRKPLKSDQLKHEGVKPFETIEDETYQMWINWIKQGALEN